ncbi:MAG: hypothetical protein J1G02_00855 [Clostridiales bacterium]|nr:hypothetical protein [Clostridiales bacterium]
MAEEKAKKPMNPVVKQWIIPVAVLVVICLVCGLLLALCNDLLYIDDDTRLSRSMQKVYPDFKLKEEIKVDTSVTASYGKINRVLLSTDGTYVIEALGTGGYQGGSVTLYVVVGADAIIKGWAVKENDKQSYIDRVPSNAGSTWYVGKDVSNELALEMTGATVVLTSTAINNAINMAAYYCRTALGLGEDPEGNAKAAILELLGDDYSGYTLNKVNLGNATIDGKIKAVDALSDDDNSLTYLFAGTGSNGTIFAYVYGADDIKIVVVSNGEILEKSENVTGEEEFVTNILANPMYTFTYGSYNAYAIITDIDVAVYTVAGLKVGTVPNSYALVVTIKMNDDGVGEVESIELLKDGETVVGNGWVSGAPSETNANILIEKLVGATSATVAKLYDDNKVSGATESANLIRVAVQAALAHYDASLASND